MVSAKNRQDHKMSPFWVYLQVLGIHSKMAGAKRHRILQKRPGSRRPSGFLRPPIKGVSTPSPKRNSKDIGDVVVDVFAAPNNMNLERTADISKEESELRIIILVSVITLILALVASAQTIIYALHWASNPDHIVVRYSNTKQKPGFPLQTVAFLSGNGFLQSYLLENDHTNLIESSSIKLPRTLSKKYFPYKEEGSIFVIYGDGNKDITKVQTDMKHSVIKNSAIPSEHGPSSGYTRVGHWIWIIRVVTQDFPYFHYLPDSSTLLWSTQRNHWMSGPNVPLIIDSFSMLLCSAAVNRTFAFVLVFSDWHLNFTSFDFQEESWKELPSLPTEMINLDDLYYSEPRVSCGIMPEKQSDNQ